MEADLRKEIEKQYSGMSDDDLISIAFANDEEFTPESRQLAVAELNKRNVSIEAPKTIETAKEIKAQAEKEKAAIPTTPLTNKQKILFSIFPAWALWYQMLCPKEWVQRRKDANKCFWAGIFLILGIGGICAIGENWTTILVVILVLIWIFLFLFILFHWISKEK